MLFCGYFFLFNKTVKITCFTSKSCHMVEPYVHVLFRSDFNDNGFHEQVPIDQRIPTF